TNDSKQKERRDQKFISMLIKDQLPINIREGAGFTKFLAEFNPYYQLPYGSCLEKINLMNDEWNAIISLTAILRPFAE
ncbi:12784_t:CDS:2, partial [Racocetra fulgida]